MDQEMSFDAFLDSVPNSFNDISLDFKNIGQVEFTTITRANLSLLRRAKELGYPGILVSCPDFEREAIAIAFLGALLHLELDDGMPGLHEVQAGEKVAVGNCVVKITDVDDTEVMYTACDQSAGFVKSIRQFPLAHLACPDAELSRTKSTKKRKYPSLLSEASRYDSLPMSLRSILDLCGKQVPSVGYVSSPSQYINEAPTHILNGHLLIGGNTYELSESIPVTYLSSDGNRHNGFSWPFDCSPSVLVAPRVDGVGSAFQIVGEASEGHPIDFVSLNVSSPELLNTSLLSDVLDLVDQGIGVIGFCDRWTLGRVQLLTDKDFLMFDWGSCKATTRTERYSLSAIQNRMLAQPHEKVLPVSDGDSGLSRAKQILYDHFGAIEIDDDDALQAVQDLFGVLGAAIRMTEAPDEQYSVLQRNIINDSVDTIRESRILGCDDFSELIEACDILTSLFEPGHRVPKEQQIYDLVTGFIDSGLPVVLVVDRNRTEAAYKYWCGELSCNGYGTELFSVMTTRDFFGGNVLTGKENIIFSGWCDKGTMDRALHSGIATNMIFVLYGHDGGGLELDWWRNANEQWHRESDERARDTNKTLSKLGIEVLSSSSKSRYIVSKRVHNSDEGGDSNDIPPSSVMTKIERQRIQKDFARDGEKSILAVPVMFHDGSHVWLKANPEQTRGGRLLVITGCLTGLDKEPDQKLAAALLPGDVILLTHSDKTYIRKTSERTTEGYDNVMALAQRWKEPIQRARMRGYTDAEIVDRIYSRVSEIRTKGGVRGWVKGKRIAPQTRTDIQAIYSALSYPIANDELDLIANAVRKIRNKHRAVGRMAAKDMVADFLKDVDQYGLDDAVKGFDDRHEAGDVELLRVTSVGERKNVAVNRVDVL